MSCTGELHGRVVWGIVMEEVGCETDIITSCIGKVCHLE